MTYGAKALSRFGFNEATFQGKTTSEALGEDYSDVDKKALYCYQNGGSHHKGRGWVSKEEAPKTHIFNMILIIIIGLSQIIFFAYANLKGF